MITSITKLSEACKLFTVAMFYYLLGNIQPKYRSKLKVIQLIAVAKSSMIAKHGVDAVLKPFVEDMKKLEKVDYNNIHTKGDCIMLQHFYMTTGYLLHYQTEQTILPRNSCSYLS